MLTNDEIRALLDEAKADLVFCEERIESLPMYDFKMTTRLTSAIEVLLARQAEVRAAFDKAYISSKSESASNAILALYNEYRAILDPQPAASIRDIADRHSFAPMPPDLGQRNIDDHTTTAALAEEKTNAD